VKQYRPSFEGKAAAISTTNLQFENEEEEMTFGSPLRNKKMAAAADRLYQLT